MYVARCEREIYTGQRGDGLIPVEVVRDSWPLEDSINSSRQVDNKLLRPIIKLMKQMLDNRAVSKPRWCNTKVYVADMLKKKDQV